MNNGSLSLAIRLCCNARAGTKLNRRHLFDNLRQITTRPSTAQASTRLSRTAFQRCFSVNANLSFPRARQSATQPSYDNFPSSKLQPVSASASHTEGSLEPDIEQTDRDSAEVVHGDEEWRRYDPAGGLPLPGGELAQEQLQDILGKDIEPDLGNYILSVMHWRRMSGALIDIGLDFPAGVDVTRIQAYQALEYLRQRFPNVDEQERGATWAAEETEKMKQALQDRAVKLRLYKPVTIDEQEEAEGEQEQTQQGTEYGRARSGTSAAQGLFAAMRARNIEREEMRTIATALKERSLLHAARGPLELGGGVQRTVGVKRYGNLDVVLREPDSIATLRTVERAPWVKHYEDQALVTKQKEVPQLSTIRRLVPSFLVMLLTVALCFYVANNYTPPPQEARLFPDTPPSVATIGALTAVLVGSFVLSRLPPLWRLNNKYFCLVPAYPYAISNIGAIFRHDTIAHLATNTITLWLVGLSLHEDVGRGTFLAIFLGSGAIGSFASLTVNVLQKRWLTYTFGASGGVLGVLAALCVVRPNGVVSVFGYELPFAAWLLLLFAGGTEVISLVRRKQSSIDNWSHIGGLISGSAAGAYLRTKWSQNQMRPEA